jgi:glutamyl/glutaminyl-tRNA synthetase
VRTFQRYLVSLDELPSLVRDVLEPGAADEEALRALGGEQVPAVLRHVVARLQTALQSGDVDGAAFKALLQECGKACGVKGKALFQPVRAALTGRGHGPDLPQLFDVIGASEALRRLQRCADDGGSHPD